MLDKFLALIAIAFFVGFLAIIAIKVPEPDLIIVIALGVAMVLFDFWQTLFRSKKTNK